MSVFKGNYLHFVCNIIMVDNQHASHEASLALIPQCFGRPTYTTHLQAGVALSGQWKLTDNINNPEPQVVCLVNGSAGLRCSDIIALNGHYCALLVSGTYTIKQYNEMRNITSRIALCGTLWSQQFDHRRHHVARVLPLKIWLILIDVVFLGCNVQIKCYIMSYLNVDTIDTI